jgi:hypothetical protein
MRTRILVISRCADGFTPADCEDHCESAPFAAQRRPQQLKSPLSLSYSCILRHLCSGCTFTCARCCGRSNRRFTRVLFLDGLPKNRIGGCLGTSTRDAFSNAFLRELGAVWHSFQLLILKQNQGSSVKRCFLGEVILY